MGGCVNHDRRSTDVEVEGPFGTKIKFYGKQLSSVLLIAAMVGGFIYLLNQHETNAATANKVALDAMGKIQANQTALAEHMDEMIYVMSLSERDREKLNIAMPASLRSKLR